MRDDAALLGALLFAALACIARVVAALASGEGVGAEPTAALLVALLLIRFALELGRSARKPR